MSFLVTGCLERVVDHAAAKHGALLTNFCDFAHNKLSKYALGFFLCELLNIVITILVTHVFLNYKYLDYGPHVYHYYSLDSETRSQRGTFNPMCEVFPSVVSCNWNRHGMGGHADLKNGICILGNNIINQKIFAFSWFWHYFLLIMGLLRISTRIMQLCSSRLRWLEVWRVYYESNPACRHL